MNTVQLLALVKSMESDAKEHDCVWYQEGASPMFETQIGKPPNITQTHCISKAREEKVEFSGPVSSFGILVTGLNFILRRLFRTTFVGRHFIFCVYDSVPRKPLRQLLRLLKCHFLNNQISYG